MKFGKKYSFRVPQPSRSLQIANSCRPSLPRNQVPEWAAFYINYKGLKRFIKVAAEAAKKGEPVVLDGI